MSSEHMHLPDVEWAPAQPFWEGCKQHQLRLPRCTCGTYVWFPQPRCAACGSDGIKWVEVSGRATLFTWTTVHRSFVPGHQSRLPYMTGIVELVEDPALRLASFLVGFDAQRPKLGMPLRVDFEEIENGIVLPVFRP